MAPSIRQWLRAISEQASGAREEDRLLLVLKEVEGHSIAELAEITEPAKAQSRPNFFARAGSLSKLPGDCRNGPHVGGLPGETPGAGPR
jgi:hypothetical protein